MGLVKLEPVLSRVGVNGNLVTNCFSVSFVDGLEIPEHPLQVSMLTLKFLSYGVGSVATRKLVINEVADKVVVSSFEKWGRVELNDYRLIVGMGCCRNALTGLRGQWRGVEERRVQEHHKRVRYPSSAATSSSVTAS